MEIKSMARIKEKWTRRTPLTADDYKLGVENPRRDWQTTTAAAGPTHKTAMAEAAAKDSFVKGVNKATTAKWKAKALLKGPGRFSEGVMVGGDDFEKGFSPARDVLEKTALPPRFPRRDPRNIARVQTGNQALAKWKTG